MLLSWEHSLILQGLLSIKLAFSPYKHYKPLKINCNSPVQSGREEVKSGYLLADSATFGVSLFDRS